MLTSEKIDQLAAALVKASEDFPKVVKDATNPHFGSRYASLGAIVDAVRPVLAQHGVIVIQSGGRADESGSEIVTRLQHATGQWIETIVWMPYAKASAQGAGSAITYGRRYGLSAALGIVADDDDDGNSAGETKPAAAQAPRPTPTTPRPTGPQPTATNTGGSTFKMPFGRTKGTELRDLSDDDIESAIKWAVEKDKFKEFVEAGRAELRRRGAGGGPGKPGSGDFSDFPKALDEGDDLPW